MVLAGRVLIGFRLPALAVLFMLAAGVDRSPAAAPPYFHLVREGTGRVLHLPFGSTDLLLSQSGRTVSIASVTFNLERSAPERLVLSVDLVAGRIVWRRSLPSATCCAFPVIAATTDGGLVALGGGQQTALFTREGRQIFAATLNDRRLHSAVGISDDGRLLVVGEWEGRTAAFAPGREAPLWTRDEGQPLMALAMSGNGAVVVAASRREIVLLRARDGVPLSRREYGPVRTAAVAVSRDSSRIGMMWKRSDGRMILEFIERGRLVWTRELEIGTVPMLQMDVQGLWLAAGDLLGRQAVLYSSRGELVWTAKPGGRAAVGVAPDGRLAAMATRNDLSVRDLRSGRTVWRTRISGAAHLLRLRGTTLAVLGAEGEQGLPDRVWFLRVPGWR